MNLILGLLYKTGLFHATRWIHPSVLTVLNYHRVDDASRPGFDTFLPNIAASPAEFARQMNYVQQYYHVITCEQLSAWLRGKGELPPYAAIITFDDGYRDNFTHAYPVLKARNLPAIIFLTTGYIGKDEPFYWDSIAYCFSHTHKKSARLPMLGSVSWTNDHELNRVMKRWIEVLKQLPEDEKRCNIINLNEILDVSIPEGAFHNLCITWDQVREMSQNGIEMGSHTVEHPILTRISLSRVKEELLQSKQRIESEIRKPVIAFAYPNGLSSDFSPEIMDLVRKTGYEVAFSLIGGSSRYADVKRNPMAIRRIFLSGSDVFPRFVAKLSWSRFLPT